MNQDKSLKVAHFAVFSPGRSGQYATVRDLILAEREIGIDAQFIDSETCLSCKGNRGSAGKTDGPITTVDQSWAWKADVLVRHSIIPDDLEDSGIPIIMCLHGRPENSFLLDQYGKVKVFHFLHQLNNDPRYHAVITFWEEFQFHFNIIMPDRKVYFVPAMVKLDEYTPEGRVHDFGKKSGSPNIIIADIWREDVTPFNLVFAALKFQEKYAPDAKLHIFGLPVDKHSPATILCNYLVKTPIAGDFYALSPNMMDKYRAADFLITPHNMATRVVREALACGCPIVAGTGNPYTSFTADPRDINEFAEAMADCWKSLQTASGYWEQNARDMAEKEFNANNAAVAIKKVFTTVVKTKADEVEAIRVENTKMTFAIAAYNSNYIEQVNVVLQSIDQIYQGRANIILYYSNIDQELITEIKELLPYIILKESTKLDCEDGDAEYKTAMKSIVWAEILQDHPELQNIVFMDADTLLVKEMGKFFTKEFDIGFCYKVAGDENLQWPINGGVMLIKNSPHAVDFLMKWGELTIKTQKNKLSQQDGYQQWGGGDQVSLGHILGTRKQFDYQNPIARFKVILQGFPMPFFNESRGIKPTINTHLVHYKGSWQPILKSGIFTPRRPEETCRPLYDLYHKTLTAWENRRNQFTLTWTPKYELEYWTAHEKQFYLKDIERLHKLFNVTKIIEDYFQNIPISNVLDVGGGAYGGEFNFYSGGTDRILFDYLADTYEEMGNVPNGVKCVKGDFGKMPFNGNSFDIIFAWEVLDHALSVGHFQRGQSELTRILKPHGLLFFNHPLYARSRKGHTVILSREEVLLGFSELENRINVVNTHGVKADLGEMMCVLTKSSLQGISLKDLSTEPPTKEKPIRIIAQSRGTTRSLSIIEFKEISVNLLQVQINPKRDHLYQQLHTGSLETAHDIMFSPHMEFLQKQSGLLKETRYYQMHKLYGKPDSFAVQRSEDFIRLFKDINQNGLKFPLLVYQLKNGSYEIIDGHHRIAAHVCSGHNTIPILVCEDTKS